MQYPRYAYPIHLSPAFLTDLLLSRRRFFRQDALACIERLSPPLHVEGGENIPSTGPCVLTVNHYHRPGFGAWWIALAIASCVPLETHWLMTSEWTYAGSWVGFVGRPLSHWLLRRLAGLYGFTSMPPMPPREKDFVARAGAVRGVLEHIRQHPQALLAMAPEGSDQADGCLAWPPPGVGRFLLRLAASGFAILPVGCWEAGGSLHLRFGSPFGIHIPASLKAEGSDRLAAQAVMQAIARQVPEGLRGEFK